MSENSTSKQDFVAVNFKQNSSLSERYEAFLTKAKDTDVTSLFQVRDDFVIVGCQNYDALSILARLTQRQGFTRCAGRILAGNSVTDGFENFLLYLEKFLPANARVRLHCYPTRLSQQLLDKFDLSQMLKEKDVTFFPTNPSHLLTAISLDNQKVYWGLYTEAEYREYIARPGDGNRDYIHDTNFNKAQAKVAEALQELSPEEKEYIFQDEGSLVVDVGAAPGGWTQYLANQSQISVIAIDPGELDDQISRLPNVRHIKMKAEKAVERCKFYQDNNILKSSTDELTTSLDNCNIDTENNVENGDGTPLQHAAIQLSSVKWKQKFRLLVCDANLDVRDSVRDLVTPLARRMSAGGIAIITLKLGRRVGKHGIERKVSSVSSLMEAAGFECESFRVVWLFCNSRNERTFIARKQL